MVIYSIRWNGQKTISGKCPEHEDGLKYCNNVLIEYEGIYMHLIMLQNYAENNKYWLIEQRVGIYFV
jgi:hypothetical protein